MAVRPLREDPLRNFKFRVIIAESPAAMTGFKSVSGLKEETEAIEYREGTDAGVPRQLVGLTKVDPVVCERGFTNDVFLINWRRRITDVANHGSNASSEGTTRGDAIRSESISFELVEYHDQITWFWQVINAWPSVWESSGWDALGNEVAVEKVTFVHEGFIIGADKTPAP